MAVTHKQHVDEDDLTYRVVAERPRRSASRSWLIAVMLFAIAAGLVYYASQLWLQQHATQGELRAARSDADEQRRKSAERGQKLMALEQRQAEQQALLQDREQKLLELNTALAAAQTRLDELDQERSEIREQLEEFRELTAQFRRMIDSGRLKITFRRGRMIVELPAQVLFPSGSAELTPEGGKALAEVAKILRSMRSRRFIVAGHTDNVPVSTERFANNWELSSARAVEVTAELIRGGLRPDQLVAAGYSEYDPVARNTSEAGRQQNRRIEIILEPRLKPLPGLDQVAAEKPKGR